MLLCKDCRHWGRDDEFAVRGEGGCGGRVVLAPCQATIGPRARDLTKPFDTCRASKPAQDDVAAAARTS